MSKLVYRGERLGLSGRWTVLAGASALAIVVGATAGAAQVAPPATPPAIPTADAPAPTEILVTAQRRSERLQRVPVSVTAVGQAQLKALNVTRPEDIAKLVPGFAAIPNNGSATSSYAIRGVSQADAAEHEEQPVAIYQDGVYLPTAAATGFPIYDVNHVEILRGPQGTLFGRNATGGLVQFLSNQPTPGLGAGIEGTIGNYSLQRVQGFVDVGNNTVADRLAVYYSKRDGYVTNLQGANLASEDVIALRNQTKFQADDATTVTLRLEGWISRGTSPDAKVTPSYTMLDGLDALLPANVDKYGTGSGKDLYGYRDPYGPYTMSVNDPGRIYKRTGTAALTIEHDVGGFSLFSISNVTSTKVQYREDTDATPNLAIRYGDGADVTNYGQEIRLQKSVGRFRWTAGANYLDINGRYSTLYSLPTFCDPTNDAQCTVYTSFPLSSATGKGATATTNYSLHVRSISVFSQGEYDLTDKLTFVLGVRYTWDREKFRYQFNCSETLNDACNAIFGVGGASNPAYVGNLGETNLHQNLGDWSGKAGVSYKLTPNVLLWASISKGVKSAGYSTATTGTVPAEALSFKPETLWDKEFGFKSSFLNGQLIVNADAYFYKYKNSQQFDFLNGLFFTVVNKPADAKGGELEVTAVPTRSLNLNLGLSYNDFILHDITTPSGDISQHAIDSPKWLINWGLTKTFALAGDMKLSVSYNGRYTGDRYFAIVNSPIIHAPAYTLHDASVRLDFNRNVYASAFVNNFTNKVYATALFDQTAQGFGLAHLGMPRMFGVSAGFKY